MNRIFLKDILNEAIGEDHKIVSRLYGGMMNISYIVEDAYGKKYVVYIPNGKANKTVDRKAEKFNTDIFVELDLTSPFIYFDTTRGIKIKEYIEGESLEKKETVDYQKVADLLHLIHDSHKLSIIDYHPFSRLGIYENKALKFAKESNDYRKLKDFFARHINYIEHAPKVLCHNDFQKSNIIEEAETGMLYVIDFEFAANNDPIYDIATFANNSIEDGEELLKAYYQEPTKEQYQRFYLWRIFISLQWSRVAVTKHYQKEGKKTKHNFLEVSKYFIENGKKAQEKFLAL